MKEKRHKEEDKGNGEYETRPENWVKDGLRPMKLVHQGLSTSKFARDEAAKFCMGEKTHSEEVYNVPVVFGSTMASWSDALKIKGFLP